MTNTFYSLIAIDTLEMGAWSASRDRITGNVALTSPSARFELRLLHARGGRFESHAASPAGRRRWCQVERMLSHLARTAEPTARLELAALSPAAMSGTAGLSPASLASARSAWFGAARFASPNADWLTLELDEGWVVGYAGAARLLVLPRDGGWLGVIDQHHDGALPESLLSPDFGESRRRLRALLAS